MIQAKTEPKMEAIPMSAAVTLRLSRITGRTVAAPPPGPPPAPRLWLASESAASENMFLDSLCTCSLAVLTGSTSCAKILGQTQLFTDHTLRSSEWSSGTFISQSACYNFDKANSFSPFPPVTTVSAANAPTGPVYRKLWYNHLILPYYHLVRLKLTPEKSWDYDQNFHANRILDRKRKDNSFKTGKNNDNRSYDY
ncbi:hypothetical protein HID58_077003 [Brassica napus]|uniref:Uncharacterized protein n=1 Tax=Brassica napus TaxID=3708 RepID=A0ABQ7YS96_BRANA|nr:hypothetical protein HID58_077003 [Brassica napus]